MFVRKKNNRAGSTSVVIIDKRAGKVRYLKTIGVSSDAKEIEDFFCQGKNGFLNRNVNEICFWSILAMWKKKKLLKNYSIMIKQKKMKFP